MLKRPNIYLTSGVLALCLGAAVPSWAQSVENRAMLDRINQLESQVRTMSGRTAGGQPYVPGDVTTSSSAGGAPIISNTGTSSSIPNFTAPDPESRLNSLEAQMRDLNGQVERASYQAQQTNLAIQKLNSDLEVRLQQLEQRQAATAAMPAAAAVTGMNNPPMTSTTTTAATNSAAGAMIADGALNQDSPSTPEELYNKAYSEMQRKEYDGATKDFKAFLASNPTHKLSPNAQYWLGEIYYSQGNYKLASATFADGYQKFPKSNKAPDNLLKLGLSLEQQSRSKDACTVLRQLTKDYPSAADTVTSSAERGIKRLKCTQGA